VKLEVGCFSVWYSVYCSNVVDEYWATHWTTMFAGSDGQKSFHFVENALSESERMAVVRRNCIAKNHEGFNAVKDSIGRLKCMGCNSHIYVPGKGFAYVNYDNQIYFSV
jgi:hypothetical protein